MPDRPKTPQWRRNQIKDVALSVLEKARVDKLPVNLRDVLKALGFLCTTFENAKAHGIIVEGTDDGYTLARPVPGGVQYMIIYNAAVMVRQRIRWTIAHEIGHIVLGHIDGAYKGGDKEAEANYFARELLAPLSVLDELGARTPAAISQTCDISSEAAELRSADFVRRDAYKSAHGNTLHDMRFLRQFSRMFDMEIATEFSVGIRKTA